MMNDTTNHSTEETKTLEEEINELKAQKPTLLDILIASPFDDKMDVDEKFTANIFYEKELFVEDDYKEHETKLIKTIKDELERNSMIMISGYAGTGKSTFIKTFIKRNPSFTHHYLTFDERSIYHSSRNNDDEILNLIKNYLERSDGIRRTIDFLVDNRRDLKARQLISNDLYEYTSKPRALESIIDVITQFDIKDTFTCFFCHFFLKYLEEKKMTIIYFDNLDNVKLEFLSASFLDCFNQSIVDANVLKNIGDFAEKGISISNFRFIFCLRDANGAVANPHLASRPAFNNVVAFKVAFKPAQYREILERRIAFLSEVFDEEHEFNGIPFSTIREFFKNLIVDDYFQQVFLPLFNKDYRTVIKALMQMLKKSGDPEGLAKDLSYIGRGNLLFGLIKYALDEDFLLRYREASIPVEGWCYIDRVLLTLIINNSKYNREKNEIGISEFDLTESAQLANCIEQLEKLSYSVDAILRAISRCFLYHETNWVHLLTIYNVNLTREKQKHFIHETTKQYKNRNEPHSQNDKSEVVKPEDRIDLNSIRVRVNLAGFTFVRYILIHFEFYSNLVNNQHPLSIKELETEINNPPKRFGFEDTIDAVIKQVKHHIASMEKFFKNNYKRVENFHTSDYCFRHLRDANVALEQGYHHSTRIITSHINYIDRFRYELVPLKFKEDAHGKTLIRIHRILIQKIEEYIELLKKSIDERGRNDFVGDFEEAIRAIKIALNRGDYKTAAEIKIIKKALTPPPPPPQPKTVIRQLIPKRDSKDESHKS